MLINNVRMCAGRGPNVSRFQRPSPTLSNQIFQVATGARLWLIQPGGAIRWRRTGGCDDTFTDDETRSEKSSLVAARNDALHAAYE